MTIFRFIQRLLFVIVIFMTGCAMLEKVILVPELNSKVSFDPALINIQVLNAVALAVNDVDVIAWNKNITFFDALEGILETGYFRKPNIAAIQLKVKIERDNKLLAITVKGAGPYYGKLPIEEAHRLIQFAITNRLAEAIQNKKDQQWVPNPAFKRDALKCVP